MKTVSQRVGAGLFVVAIVAAILCFLQAHNIGQDIEDARSGITLEAARTGGIDVDAAIGHLASIGSMESSKSNWTNAGFALIATAVLGNLLVFIWSRRPNPSDD